MMQHSLHWLLLVSFALFYTISYVSTYPISDQSDVTDQTLNVSSLLDSAGANVLQNGSSKGSTPQMTSNLVADDARKPTSPISSQLPSFSNESNIEINLLNVLRTSNAEKDLVRGKSQRSIDNGDQGGKGPKRPVFPVKGQQSFEADRVGGFPNCPKYSRLIFGPGPKCPTLPPFIVTINE